MSIEFTPNELTILHMSVERLAGTISASIAHFQRAGARELADLHQLGLEDLVRLRDLLRAKGASAKPITAPPNASRLGPVSVRDALLPDPVEAMALVIEGAESAA